MHFCRHGVRYVSAHPYSFVFIRFILAHDNSAQVIIGHYRTGYYRNSIMHTKATFYHITIDNTYIYTHAHILYCVPCITALLSGVCDIRIICVDCLEEGRSTG